MVFQSKKCPCEGGTLTRFIQPVILTILAGGDDHGYSILLKISTAPLWKDSKPDASGLYRTLKDMEERGLVTSYLDMTNTRNIGKRVFSITEAGLECMFKWETTLREYQEGIDQIINNIELALEQKKRKINVSKKQNQKSF